MKTYNAIKYTIQYKTIVLINSGQLCAPTLSYPTCLPYSQVRAIRTPSKARSAGCVQDIFSAVVRVADGLQNKGEWSRGARENSYCMRWGWGLGGQLWQSCRGKRERERGGAEGLGADKQEMES